MKARRYLYTKTYDRGVVSYQHYATEDNLFPEPICGAPIDRFACWVSDTPTKLGTCPRCAEIARFPGWRRLPCPKCPARFGEECYDLRYGGYRRITVPHKERRSVAREASRVSES